MSKFYGKNQSVPYPLQNLLFKVNPYLSCNEHNTIVYVFTFNKIPRIIRNNLFLYL